MFRLKLIWEETILIIQEFLGSRIRIIEERDGWGWGRGGGGCVAEAAQREAGLGGAMGYSE